MTLLHLIAKLRLSLGELEFSQNIGHTGPERLCQLGAFVLSLHWCEALPLGIFNQRTEAQLSLATLLKLGCQYHLIGCQGKQLVIPTGQPIVQ